MLKEKPSRNYKLLVVIILSLFAITVYSNTFSNSFHFDDSKFIIDNSVVRNIADIKGIWNFWPTRFMSFMTFAFNYQFGRLDLFGYHLFNLIVHLGVALLFFWFLVLTFSTPVMRRDNISRYYIFLSLFAALIFLVHPVQTESVTYITQRMASLAGFFYLFSLSSYAKARLEQINGNKVSIFWKWYFLAWFFALAGMFTKENTVTLPVMIIFYEACFFSRGRYRRWKYALPFLILLPIIPILLFSFKPENFADIERFFGHSGNTKAGYLFTQIRVIVTYIRLIFLPLKQNLDYDYHFAKTLLEFPILASLVFLFIILTVAARLFLKYRLISFAIFWFFLTLLPESSIIPLDDLIFEHRLYLPLAGYSIFITTGLYYFFRGKIIKPFVVILSLLVIVYSVAAYNRNRVWRDELVLWDDVVRKSPGKARAYTNRGLAFLKNREYDKAIADFNRALKINPRDTNAYNNRGVAFQQTEKYDKAIADFNRALEIDSKDADAYNNRGIAYYAMKEYDKSVFDFSRALEIKPYSKESHYNRGMIFRSREEYNKAVSDFKEALRVDPDNINAIGELAGVYFNKGNVGEAGELYEKLFKLAPNSIVACNGIAAASAYIGDFKKAVEFCEKAISIDSNYTESYVNIASAYGALGEYDKSIEYSQKALKINPDLAVAYSNLAVAYFFKEEYSLAVKYHDKAVELGGKINPDFSKDLAPYRKQEILSGK